MGCLTDRLTAWRGIGLFPFLFSIKYHEAELIVFVSYDLNR